MMTTYGLIGFPLGHSFSAAYFTRKFQEEEIAAEYNNYPMQSVDDVRTFVSDTPQLQGFNVTIPHKESVLPHLDELSIAAQQIGAVNVVKVERKNNGIRLLGYNTDFIGFRDSLRPLLTERVHKALVLGTGGASKAVTYALRSMDIEPQLVSRTRRKEILSYEDLDREIIKNHPLIVNCTPLGTFPNIEGAPPIPYEHLTAENILYDLVYNPSETRFMILGKQQGAVVKNGLEMLHLQAQAAWKIWNADAI